MGFNSLIVKMCNAFLNARGTCKWRCFFFLFQFSNIVFLLCKIYRNIHLFHMFGCICKLDFRLHINLGLACSSSMMTGMMEWITGQEEQGVVATSNVEGDGFPSKSLEAVQNGPMINTKEMVLQKMRMTYWKIGAKRRRQMRMFSDIVGFLQLLVRLNLLS